MLNRTNLTLSALSNRLNLGTRSLVLTTSVNNGAALHIRHAHQDVMRDVMAVADVAGSFAASCAAPPITGPAAAAAPCVPAWSSRKPPVAVDASPRSDRSWRGWRSRSSAGLGVQAEPSSRSRSDASARRLGAESRRRPGSAVISKPGWACRGLAA